MIKVGSDFSGVGAFDQALLRLGIDYMTVFACDMDKYARETFIHNYGEPEYYPKDVYERGIPSKSLDIYMTSPPCQSFSLAGKRKGEDDDRGVLFYNSHEFIKVNKPRYFIFENVKGLLSDAGGLTFRRWCEYLGGKSINGNPVIFPHEESVPYHIYFKVLNAKNYNIPQNRERVFIVGIRDDEDNNFTWPKEMFLEKRLRDVLERDVDEKYYLSEKLIKGFIQHEENQKTKGNGFKFEPKTINSIGNCITARCFKMGVDDNYIKVESAVKQGYEIAKCGEDIINFEHPKSKTRRGRVGVDVGQTLTTSCNQGVAIGAIRGRNPYNPNSRQAGLPTRQMLEINENGTSNALTTVQKDNVVVEKFDFPKVKVQLTGEKWDKTHEQNCRVYDENGISPTIQTMGGGNQEPKILEGSRIRKLTPRECFRLMDFPDTLVENARKAGVSDTQLYKQAGNSICVGVLAAIISKLNLTPLPNKEEERR